MLDVTLQIPVDPETRNKVAQMAQSERRKLASMGRVLIHEALEARQRQGGPDDEPDDKRLMRKSAAA